MAYRYPIGQTSIFSECIYVPPPPPPLPLPMACSERTSTPTLLVVRCRSMPTRPVQYTEVEVLGTSPHRFAPPQLPPHMSPLKAHTTTPAVYEYVCR